MNPKHPHDPWTRLIAAARTVRDERPESAPFGFSTRVAARALAGRRQGGSLIERFAWRAVGVAALLAIASVAVNYSFLNPSAPEDQQLAADDPMSVLLDV